jgi:hypothetical protein
MNRCLTGVVATLLASLAAPESTALAADPTTADCLAASEARISAGNQHKLRAERGFLLLCAAPSCPAEIREECSSRMEQVNAQIPTVIFQAKDAAGGDVVAVKVSMDGEVLAQRLEGTALSTDPGKHTFTFEAAGLPPVTKTLVMLTSQKLRREQIFLGAPPSPSPAVPAPTTAPPPVQGDGATSPAQGDATPPGLGTQKALALVAAGIGIVGIGVGVGFGAVAISDKSAAQSACPNGLCPTQAAADQWSTAGSAGNVSTIAFVVGGVGLAGAAALWLTAPAGRPQSTAQVGFGLGSLQVRGTW